MFAHFQEVFVCCAHGFCVYSGGNTDRRREARYHVYSNTSASTRSDIEDLRREGIRGLARYQGSSQSHGVSDRWRVASVIDWLLREGRLSTDTPKLSGSPGDAERVLRDLGERSNRTGR